MAEDGYTISVDGPGVNLKSVDPIEAMMVAVEYLRLLNKVAEHLQVELRFSGLAAVPGSAGLQTVPSNPSALLPVLSLAELLVTGRKYPPKELRAATKTMQNVLRELPEGHVAKTRYGREGRVLLPREAVPPPTRIEYVTFRAEVVNVGGTKSPQAKFREKLEGTIAVAVTEDQAREIGAHMYQLAEVSMRVERSAEGKIEDASLISFEPIAAGDAWAAWRQWFQENASKWNEIDDVDAALSDEVMR